MVWISRKNLTRLQEEAKGFYGGDNSSNEYFAAIESQLRGTELAPISPVDRGQIRHIYETSAPVQGVVNLIADNVGEVMRYLELRDGNGDIVEKDPVIDLLRRPSDRYSLRKFGKAWAVNRLLFGDAWTYIPDSIGKYYGIPKEMYVIPSQRVAVEKDGLTDPMKGIKITGHVEGRAIDMAHVFESFDYNLDDTSFFGTSKLVSAALYLSVMDKGIRREDTSLRNGGVANVVTPASSSLSPLPAEKDQIEQTFNKKTNVGKTIALRAPIEVHQLGNAPVDLNILESHKEAVTALCFVYKLPVDLYYGQSKYENAKEAKKTIYEQNAIPMANEFGEDLLHFLRYDEKGYTLEVNTDEIDVLQDKPGDVLDNLAKMHASLNEMREAYGYDRIEEDYADKPILPMAVQFGPEEYDINE